MNDILVIIPDIVAILLLLVGIYIFNSPATAKYGNLMAAAAMLGAVALTIVRYQPVYPWLLVVGIGFGCYLGWLLAVRIHMIQIPAMVGMQNGAGGCASALVAYLELIAVGSHPEIGNQVFGVLGLLLGMATFSGSILAAGKLAGRLSSAPRYLRYHGTWLVLTLVMAIVSAGAGVVAAGAGAKLVLFLFAALLALAVGIIFSMRIGGADMPVLISFLNASTGLAAAACGVVLGNRLLITFGATVFASGWILTHLMCRSMNRSLFKVFVGIKQTVGTAAPLRPKVQPEAQAPQESTPASVVKALDPLSKAVEIGHNAQSVVIVPGYGMALARAQFKVVELAEYFRKEGKSVKFAVHPVAGRMPGHMHVLLAEADVDYSLLFEMDDINAEFKTTDLVLVVGACDVVNPSAMGVEGTPISGMPILLAKDARNIIVCNLDEKPGYSGVENLLYQDPKTIMLLGDAQATVTGLLDRLLSGASAP